ncbi:UvrD-helicase domain-containing protein, partial [Candidatus Azambacteria bacterium]|nr:UvrD-helicase domain-containing protein [Candidatus Azambacteria bacterium]
MSTLLNSLNQPQKEAVLSTEGPLLVVAGAGSGKTKVLTSRIAYLISEKGVKPENILAVTFTNKAANEMKERVFKLVGSGLNGFNIGTFHSICVRMLREHAELAGYKKNFIIFDDDDQKSLIKTILKELNIDAEKFKPSVLQGRISTLKNSLKTSEEFEKEASDYFQKTLLSVYEKYQKGLREQNAVDFDDIIMLVVRLLKNHKEILEKYQEKYKYILVDEYQDTNSAQYNLIKMLAAKHKNICVVGDSDQSIYSWRDADYTNILNFEKDYPNAQVVVLEENYRSTQNILNAANDIIKKNKTRKEKSLFTKNEKGAKINVILASSEKKEAEFIAKTVKETAKKENRKLSDFVVLYRTNAQSRAVEEEFMKANLPYKIIGGFKFYQRKEVKDIIGYLRYIYNESDIASFKRIVNTPARGIGKKALENYFQKGEISKNLTGFFEIMKNLKELADSLPLSKLIKEIGRKSGIEKDLNDGTEEGKTKWENVLELVSVASIYDSRPDAIPEFLENVSLVSDVDELDVQKPAVNLMTMH